MSEFKPGEKCVYHSGFSNEHGSQSSKSSVVVTGGDGKNVQFRFEGQGKVHSIPAEGRSHADSSGGGFSRLEKTK